MNKINKRGISASRADRTKYILPAVDKWDKRTVSYREFIRLLLNNEDRIDKSIDRLAALIPSRQDFELKILVTHIRNMARKAWHLEALCMAEMVQRFPAQKGGRGKKATVETSRDQAIKRIAENLNCGVTKVRENIAIIETFGVVSKISKTSPEGGEVFQSPNCVNSTPEVEVYVEETPDKEFIRYGYINDKSAPNIISVSFTPHPNLERQHYVIASKLSNSIDAQNVIEKVTDEVTSGNSFPASQLQRILKPDFKKMEGYCEYKLDSRYKTLELKFVLNKKAVKIFHELVELELGIKGGIANGSVESGEIFRQRGLGLLIRAFVTRLALIKIRAKRN